MNHNYKRALDGSVDNATESDGQPPVKKRRLNSEDDKQKTDKIQQRSKERIQEMKQRQLEEEKEEDLKHRLREEIHADIAAKIKGAKSAVELINILCPNIFFSAAATKSEIQKAFKTALRQCHPDKAVNKSLRERVEAEETFKLLCTEKEKMDQVPSLATHKNAPNRNTRRTSYDHYFENKAWQTATSAEWQNYDVNVRLSDDREFVYVKGATFQIKEDLKQCGLGWNPKECAWQIRASCLGDSIKDGIAIICADHKLSLFMDVEQTDPVQDVTMHETVPYDFRIWYDTKKKTMFVTPQSNMNDFWEMEGFQRKCDGIWTQSQSVFTEAYLDVIKEQATEQGVVFQYCDVQPNLMCKQCRQPMRILTARKGEPWNYGRKFFKCMRKECDTFRWVDGTKPYSAAACRRAAASGEGYPDIPYCCVM